MTISIDDFKTTNVNEWGEAFGLIGLVPDTTAYELVTDEYVFAIGFTEEWEEDGSWVCQIDDRDGGNLACWDGETPEQALDNAAVQCCETEALNENDNCEDAVNQMSFAAFEMLNDMPADFADEDVCVRLDAMMGMATYLVKRDGERHGITWEPYQVCEA